MNTSKAALFRVRAICMSAFAVLVIASQALGAEVTLVSVPGNGRAVKAQCAADGTIHLLYDSAESCYYVRSTDGGKTFTEPLEIVDKAAKAPGLNFSGSDMAIGQGGRVYVAMSTNAWKLKLPQSEWGYFYAVLEPQAKTFTPVLNLNKKPSEGFSLAADGKGAIAAIWLSGKLYSNLSQDDGRKFGNNSEIDTAYDPCNCCTTSAAFAHDRLGILYREETDNRRDMYMVIVQKDGTHSRTRVSSTLWEINACPMTYFTLVPSDEGFVAAWPTKKRVYFARLDKDGKVQPPGEVDTGGETGMRNSLVALAGKDGSTLIGWKNSERLFWRIYGRDGKPIGVQGSSNGQSVGAVGAVTSDGRFLLFK